MERKRVREETGDRPSSSRDNDEPRAKRKRKPRTKLGGGAAPSKPRAPPTRAWHGEEGKNIRKVPAEVAAVAVAAAAVAATATAAAGAAISGAPDARHVEKMALAAVAARGPRTVVKASARATQGNWRVGRGGASKIYGRTSAQAVLDRLAGKTEKCGGGTEVAAAAAAAAAGSGDDEAEVGAYDLCVHEEIFARAKDGRPPLPWGSESETCTSTIFTDSMGGSYICTRTGMVMGEGLITLAEREHAGALAEYGSDGEDECAENSVYVSTSGGGTVSKQDATLARRTGRDVLKVAATNQMDGARNGGGGTVAATAAAAAATAATAATTSDTGSKNAVVVRNFAALMLCHTNVVNDFSKRRNTTYFVEAGKATLARRRAIMEPPRPISRAAAVAAAAAGAPATTRPIPRCPFPHEIADAYSAPLSKRCVLPSTHLKAETIAVVSKLLLCAHGALAGMPAGRHILASTPIPLYVGFLFAMQGEGNIYPVSYLRTEGMPNLARALAAQSAASAAAGRMTTGPFDDPLDCLVCIPTGRFLNDLPAPADLSSISKTLKLRRRSSGRARGYLAHPETSHVTSGATCLKKCFLSMARTADAMEAGASDAELGAGLSYIYEQIRGYRELIRAAEPIFVSYN
jgi:hypothetical protein